MRTLVKMLSVAAAALAATSMPAQDAQRSAPKLPEPPPPPGWPTQPTFLPVPVEKADDAIIPSLKGIAIFDNYALAKTNNLAGLSGIKVFAPAFLRDKEFEALLARHLNRPIGTKGLETLVTNIVTFCRQKGHIVVDAVFPERAVDEGVVPVAVLEGKVSKFNVVVNNRTNRLQDVKGILRHVRTHTGDVVIQDRLLADMDWLQRVNPFREVYRVSFEQAANVTAGTTDLELDVWEQSPYGFKGRDRIPARFYVGYENSGNEVLGEDRLVAGFNWAKLWGLDHQLNYQFASDLQFDRMQSYAGSYLVPLPWRHILMAYGSYASMDPDLTKIGVPEVFRPSQEGRTYQGSLRYTVPLRRFRQYSHEFALGFDYKNANSNLEFGGQRITATPTEIGQFTLEYRGFLPDRWGQTAFDLYGFYNPGGLFSHDNTADYQTMRLGAEADYHYIHADLERQFKLPILDHWRERPVRDNYVLAVQVRGQYASGNLLPSETLGLGGYATVRGFEERLVNGDNGLVVRTELRSPAFKLRGQLFAARDGGVSLQGLAFFDYGMVTLSEVLPGEPDQFTLTSVGCGLRFSAGQNLAVRVDYGYQLNDDDLDGDDWRFHVSAVLSF